MNPLLGAALISGGSSLLGGFLASSSNKKINARNIQQQVLDREYQKEFAQQGIQWRTQDAKAAGIHPLYAMGASIPAFTPSAQNVGANENPFQGLAQAGQDIGNAVVRTQTKGTREQITMARLQIVNQSLQNDILRSQLLGLKVPAQPAFPHALQPYGQIEGQGLPSSLGVQINPSVTTAVTKGDPSTEASTIPSSQFMNTGPDGYMRVPGKEAKERMEENIFLTALWNWRTFGKPIFVPGAEGKPPPMKPPKGYRWYYNRIGFTWQIEKIGSREKTQTLMKKVLKEQALKRQSRRKNRDYPEWR